MAQIWVGRSGKGKVCAYHDCQGHITYQDPQVVVKDYGKYQYFHPDCWLKDAFEKLGPPKVRRGKQPLDITEEQREVRNKILRRMASVRTQLNRLSKHPEKNAVKIQRLELNHELLRRQLVPVGGIPYNLLTEEERLAPPVNS